MKKNQISNFLSDTITYKTDTFFVNKRVPYENQRTYNATLVYKSIWKDLFAGPISTELTNGLITTPPHTLAPDKLYPYVWSGGFSSEPLSIPDNIIQHVRVNIEINIPDEMIIAPSVLTWERDASFQMLAYYDSKELYTNGGSPEGLSPILRGTPHKYEFWNPSWSYDDWRRVWLDWSTEQGFEVSELEVSIPPYPYYRFTYSLPCYFLKSSEFLSEGEGDTTIYLYMLYSQMPPFGEEFGQDYPLKVIALGQGYDYMAEKTHDIPEGNLYNTDDWYFSNQLVRPAIKKYDLVYNVPTGDGWLTSWADVTNIYYNPYIVLSPIGLDCDSTLGWPTEPAKELKTVWNHQKPHTQICPQETSYSFRKISNNKWQIVGHVRICVAQPSTHEVGQALDGDEAPMLYMAQIPTTIKPQIRVTASLCSPDNVTTGYIRNQS